jgi:methyl-accepting chemotaxis protein
MIHVRKRSLAFIVTAYTALVIAGGMTLYAIYQYLATPGQSAMALALEHGLHVLAYGVALYLSLSLVLYRKVVRPIRQLDVKLYAISKGDLSPISVKTNVREVQEIAQVVNFLLKEIGRPVPEVSLSDLSGGCQKLRVLAHELEDLDDSTRQAFVGIANGVEEVVEALSRLSLQERVKQRTALV